jgi:ribosomal protein S18 acetylase RimI-like enzyme
MTDPDLTTRPATEEGLPVLFDLHRAVFRAHIEKIWGWDEVWQQRRFREECAESETAVVWFAGRIAGYIQIVLEAERLMLRNVAIHPDVQGQGIGAALVEEMMDRATALGLPVALGVFRTNPRAGVFYERLGFRRAGENETHVKMEWSPGRH